APWRSCRSSTASCCGRTTSAPCDSPTPRRARPPRPWRRRSDPASRVPVAKDARMATAATPETPPPYETVADLRKHVGNLPPQRLRLQPPPGTATEEDMLACRNRIGRLCELVDGILVEKPVGYYESRLAIVLAGFLEAFLSEHDLGIVLGGDGPVRVQ